MKVKWKNLFYLLALVFAGIAIVIALIPKVEHSYYTNDWIDMEITTLTFPYIVIAIVPAIITVIFVMIALFVGFEEKEEKPAT